MTIARFRPKGHKSDMVSHGGLRFVSDRERIAQIWDGRVIEPHRPAGTRIAADLAGEDVQAEIALVAARGA